MEVLLDNDILSKWLIQYGSFALFFLLIVGIIILPVPEETLMVIAGALMRNGTLPITHTMIAAYAGSMCGITISYLMGRTAGHYLIMKYGSYFGVTHERLEKIHLWFEKYGKWTLVFGYFIPGIRHFTGFTTGMTELEYGKFALFAYTGALLWVSTFLAVGYFFGNYCCSLLEELDIGVVQILIFIVVAVIVYVLCVKFKVLSYFKTKDKS